MRGYIGQYESAGAAIYAELERGQLLWIGVADRSAGIVDDLVLGFDGLVVGHQFKTAKFPGTFTVETIFTGADGLLKPLVKAWRGLRKNDPGSRVEIRLVVNDYPSVNDKPGGTAPAHSAAFLDEFERFSNRSLQEWRASSWSRLIETLRQASGLDDDDFEQFLHALRVLHGAAADFVQFHKLSPEQARLAAEIAMVLPKLVTDVRDKDRWSREELLQELGWRDPAKTRHLHRFPVGAYAQRNRDTELSLIQALRAVDQGYVALVGPPGRASPHYYRWRCLPSPMFGSCAIWLSCQAQRRGWGEGRPMTSWKMLQHRCATEACWVCASGMIPNMKGVSSLVRS
ncbi:hypothetical protein [Pseudomonas sp. S1Bt23]|uniref:hypothetical protein n=1 Tax=Pseudomonas sp. S1Bt23 TaxID=3095074 RepID=UPI002A59F26F|nr:hypothetical protein [Pseudomonas sp. S1Bt23]WPO48683.1 hypothetical protein SHB59_06295 [Pseudomonas sp. S1Bt23]